MARDDASSNAAVVTDAIGARDTINSRVPANREPSPPPSPAPDHECVPQLRTVMQTLVSDTPLMPRNAVTRVVSRCNSANTSPIHTSDNGAAAASPRNHSCRHPAKPRRLCGVTPTGRCGLSCRDRVHVSFASAIEQSASAPRDNGAKHRIAPGLDGRLLLGAAASRCAGIPDHRAGRMRQIRAASRGVTALQLYRHVGRNRRDVQ